MKGKPKRMPRQSPSCRWILAVLFAGLLFISGCASEKGPVDGKVAPQFAEEDDRGNPKEYAPEEDFSLSTLFPDAGEYKYIHPAYSADAESGAPWGFKHQGLDLIAAKSGAWILVPADGLAQQVQEYLNPVNNQWQVNLHIRCDDRFSYNLLFEPRAATAEQNALQRAAIRVSENERVTAGDTLGAILNLSSEATGFGDVTVHFDLWVDGQNVCPEPYFKPEALAALLSLLHAKYPEGKLCYSSAPTGVE